jgi:uncharacterized membrane protein
MWVPGADASKPAKSPQAASMPPASIPAASTPATSASVQPKDKLTAALAYITFIPAVIFVLIEPFKRNPFVRFHAFQSIFFAAATILAAMAMRALYAVLALIPVLGYLLAWLGTAVGVLGCVILWLVLLVKALQGETFRLPWIGSLAEKA